jgi:hypothetical protein
MKLTRILSIDRFVSIDERTIVRISRCEKALDAYYDPPVIRDVSMVWGTCLNVEPDSFCEVGDLEHVLKDIAPQPMVAATAIASPRGFAQMVAAAHNLGYVFSVASRAIQLVVDHIPDAKRFCSIEVDEASLNFHTLLSATLDEEPRAAPGIYGVSYSLANYVIRRMVLVEHFPKPGRTTRSS